MKEKQETLFSRGIWFEVGLRLKSYTKKSTKNPLWLVMSILGRFLIFRRIAQVFAQKWYSLEENVNRSIFQWIQPSEVVDSLNRDGFYGNIILPPSILYELLKFSKSYPCYGDAEHHNGFLIHNKLEAEKIANKCFSMAQYFNTNVNCPVLNKLKTDPLLLKIAAQYLGGKPVYTGSRIWWLFVNENYNPNKVINFFHYDLDDYRSLRFFFYLNDVSYEDGPHIAVRGSHIHKKLVHIVSPIKRKSDQEIINYYQSSNINTFCGEAGWGFAEDTFCFHKATAPVKQDRLMLQLQFALWDYGNHNDFAPPHKLKNLV